MNMLRCFEETVKQFPDKTAVAYRDDKYTFAQLQDGAGLLGKMVLQRCDGTDRGGVAVLVNRSAHTTLFFLGVLYSGHYYIPIDPDMPVAKKQSILEDSKPALMIYEDEQEEIAQAMGYEGPVIRLSDIQALWEMPVHSLANEQTAKPAAGPADTETMQDGTNANETTDIHDIVLPEISAGDPIYMVYTSGSTGKPKGVIKNHGAVYDFISTFTAFFNLGSEEIIGNQTPFFFDASAKDLYLMLYTGATMEILPSEMFVLPINLINYLNEKKITYVCWVPTALAIVTQLNTFQVVVPETLKKVFFVGEVFPIKQLRKWVETLPQIEYVNLYGSTEISGISCYYRIDTSQSIERIPMGYAMPNCEMFLMDGDRFVEKKGPADTDGPAGADGPADTDGPADIDGRVASDEITGEVCVISKALSTAYFNDPEKTAKTFVMMDLPDGRRERVLRTGDLARINEDGSFDFVSRKDFQIKHMGRRIELGEIESVVDSLACIQRCCCLYDSEKKKIRLFCELVDGFDMDKKAIKHELRDKLSDYMMPQVIKIMEKLPLNANGKIDRNSLKLL